MSQFRICWVSENLAVGQAPMSYDNLEFIRKEGVSAILNLCGEYCDLHEIEAGDGFEVHYLPIMDECAPDMDALDVAIDWMQEMIDSEKKVMVHCRFGVGRTGTVVTAFLIRQGLDFKAAARILKKTPAEPSNYCQWKLLRKYRKKNGV